MKIRPPSACNPARFARHCLARAPRDVSVRLLARERCGIRARCVRARAVVVVVVVVVVVRACARVHLVVAPAPARAVQRLEQPSSSSARVVDEVDAEEDRDRDEKGVENSVRLRRDDEARRTTRGERATTTTTRGRRRRRRRCDSRFDAFVVATTRGCIDARVFVRAFKMCTKFDSNASVGARVALFEI